VKILRYITLTIALIIAAAYIFIGDYLPPRTATKAARILTGLSVPSNSKVLSHTELWGNLNGDGLTFVHLQLTEDQMRKLVADAPLRDYATLEPGALPKRVRDALHANSQGFMYVSGHPDSKAVVLDTAANQLLVYQLVD
jgi:hypothetical protein